MLKELLADCLDLEVVIEELVQFRRNGLRGVDWRTSELIARAIKHLWTLQKINIVVGVEFPKIICLCGSTRFYQTFHDKGLELTLQGYIVLSIGSNASDIEVLAHPETELGKRQKEMLDDLHKRKIDLADEVLVLNVGGYIGESTKGEIEYAKRLGKVVRWLE